MDPIVLIQEAPPSCAQCNKTIYDSTIYQVNGRYWHNACLQCCVCSRRLDGCCHVREKKLYCRKDFVRLFGARCSSCREVISPSEYAHVINEYMYHTSCFVCSICSCKLVPGQYFYMRDDASLMCANDYRVILENSNSDTDSESDESGSDDTFTATDVTNLHDNQIRLLLDAYNQNNRPNKSSRRLLSQQTGMKSRLIHIWFRNKRSQDKQLKRKSRNLHSISDSCVNNDKNKAIPIGCQNKQEEGGDFNSPGQSTTQNKSGAATGPETRDDHMNQNEARDFQNEVTDFDSYQLFCSLDYLLPNEMPPNIDLSEVDICNGEVVSRKRNKVSKGQNNAHAPEVMAGNGSCSWLPMQ